MPSIIFSMETKLNNHLSLQKQVNGAKNISYHKKIKSCAQYPPVVFLRTFVASYLKLLCDEDNSLYSRRRNSPPCLNFPITWKLNQTSINAMSPWSQNHKVWWLSLKTIEGSIPVGWALQTVPTGRCSDDLGIAHSWTSGNASTCETSPHVNVCLQRWAIMDHLNSTSSRHPRKSFPERSKIIHFKMEQPLLTEKSSLNIAQISSNLDYLQFPLILPSVQWQIVVKYSLD